MLKFFREPVSGEQSLLRLEQQLSSRDEALLRILERAVYANPRSPYRRLLEHAGVELHDVGKLVEAEGVEGALGRLHDSGVTVTLDEFRGRQPICRPGLELNVRERDFDNPLLASHYEARTGGSRSGGRRLTVDPELLAHEAGYQHLFLSAFGLEGRPHAVWFPVPPGGAGMKTLLRQAKLGRSSQRWFAQNALSLRPAALKYAAFTAYVQLVSRIRGMALPRPEHVPLEEARRVAAWLAATAADGTPALLETNWSSAVRACAAVSDDLDITGTFFRVGSEPASEARGRAITDTGSAVACHYAMGEVGLIGMACAAPRILNDVHLLADKLAVIERPPKGGPTPPITSLHLTTLLPSSPKLMLNVDSGDSAALERRSCGCLFEKAGFTSHLSGITSYEKLTAGGMHFLGSELVTILDAVLPSRFGGVPGDYQLVEGEVGTLSRIDVVVDPGVGEVDEREVIIALLEGLSAAGEPQRLMADQWRQGDVLRVVRRPPYAVPGAKVLPLHRVRRAE